MTLDDGLTLLVLVVTGFTACAEFGSYAFVHPVIRRLPHEQHVLVEQGLVRTFGRVMPALMPASLLLLIAWRSREGITPLTAIAVGLWAIGLVTTIVVNVGINAQTARWSEGAVTEPTDAAWNRMRRRWEWFQGFRSWAFLIAYALVCVAVVSQT